MSQKRQILHYIQAYLLWLVSMALAIFTLNLTRETVLLAVVISSNAGDLTNTEKFYRSLSAGAIASWSVMLMGLLVLILLVTFEHIFRSGVAAGDLWKRSFLVMGILCAFLFVVNTIYFILQTNYLPLRWWFIVIPAVEALLAGLFLWLRFGSPKIAILSRV
jgi:hypothetical protein